MQAWWQEQLASNFQAFKGATLSGSIPLREALLNEWLAELLARSQRSADLPGAVPLPAGLGRLTALIASARVQIADGVLTLHVDVRV